MPGLDILFTLLYLAMALVGLFVLFIIFLEVTERIHNVFTTWREKYLSRRRP